MSSYEAVKKAITRRIAHSEAALLQTFGPQRVMEEIETQASAFSDTQLEEIGSSDVSCWVLDIKERLAASGIT